MRSPVKGVGSLCAQRTGSLPRANVSAAPGTSKIIATPARTHLAGGYLVLSWAGKT